MVCKRSELRYIERLPNGWWAVRYGVHVIGSQYGEDLVECTESCYPQKPTLEQVKASVRRYVIARGSDTIDDEALGLADLSCFNL